MEKGDRVLAIQKADGKTAYVFGEGVYEGYEQVPEEISPLLHSVGIPSPKIKLDSGHTLYGFECWWGPLEKTKEHMKGVVFVDVDVDEFRKSNNTQNKTHNS